VRERAVHNAEIELAEVEPDEEFDEDVNLGPNEHPIEWLKKLK
jgi:hypothetical protein